MDCVLFKDTFLGKMDYHDQKNVVAQKNQNKKNHEIFNNFFINLKIHNVFSQSSSSCLFVTIVINNLFSFTLTVDAFVNQTF